MKVPQFMPYVNMEEWEATKPCFEENWITEGPRSKIFAEKLCETTLSLPVHEFVTTKQLDTMIEAIKEFYS